MALQIKKLPGSEVEISVEVPAEDFEKYYKEAFDEILKDVSMPGFRPGKVPPEIAAKNVKNEDILKGAAEKAIHATYFPVLKEKKIEAVGRPEITITKIAKGDSFCFKAITPVLPEITLPDYKKLAGDVRSKKEEAPTLAESEVGVPTPPKESVGKEKKYDTEKARQKKRMEMLKAISAAAEMEIPEILVITEREKMVGELKVSIENMGMKWQDYLVQIKKTEEELKKEWQNDAVARVKYGLVLRELAEKENIQVGAEEIEPEVEEILKHNPGVDRNYVRSYIYGILRNEKVFRFLEEI